MGKKIFGLYLAKLDLPNSEAYLRSCRESAAMVVDYGGWTRIDCARDGQVRSVDDIHREVMERLRDLLEGIK